MDHSSAPPAEVSIGDDKLRGAGAIGAFLGEDKRRVYYLADRRLITVGKEGSQLIASKSRLKREYEEATRGR